MAVLIARVMLAAAAAVGVVLFAAVLAVAAVPMLILTVLRWGPKPVAAAPLHIELAAR